VTRENLVAIERRIEEIEAEMSTLQYVLVKSGKRARAIDMLEAYNRKFLSPDLTTINFPVMKRDASYHIDDEIHPAPSAPLVRNMTPSLMTLGSLSDKVATI
jgi:hypothetical protein